MWKFNTSRVGTLFKLLTSFQYHKVNRTLNYSQLSYVICRRKEIRLNIAASTFHTITNYSEGNGITGLDCSASLQPVFLFAIEQRRYRRKSYRLKKEQEDKTKKRLSGESESDDEYEDDDDDSDDDEDEDSGDGDSSVPTGYKDMVVAVGSLRCDGVLSSGLGVSRGTIEDAFYGNKILVNGKNISKKSHPLEEGDIVDVVLSKVDNKLNVQRVIVRQVFGGLTANLMTKVAVRRWKAGIEIDNAT